MTGVARATFEPSPSWPYMLLPQAMSALSHSTASECRPREEMSRALPAPVTLAATDEPSVSKVGTTGV